MLERHSLVKVAACGLKTTLLFVNKGLSLSGGSFSKKDLITDWEKVNTLDC